MGYKEMSLITAIGWAITLLIFGSPLVAGITWDIANGTITLDGRNLQQDDYVTYALVALFCIGLCTCVLRDCVNELLRDAYHSGMYDGREDQRQLMEIQQAELKADAAAGETQEQGHEE